MTKESKILVVACGAIARELVRIRDVNAWSHLDIQCLPAELHNTPDKIPDAVMQKIRSHRANHEEVFVAYADCGTGGLLDKALDGIEAERIPGAHCYEFFAGSKVFHALAEQEAGSFYLTDFLVKHFDRLVIRGLALDRRPELKPMYFGNYRRVVYIAQTENEELLRQARAHADYLELDFHHEFCGDDPLSLTLKPIIGRTQACQN